MATGAGVPRWRLRRDRVPTATTIAAAVAKSASAPRPEGLLLGTTRRVSSARSRALALWISTSLGDQRILLGVPE